MRILIANRGEIAIRIMKTIKKLGHESIAIYSDIEKDALHLKYADEAYCVGGATLKSSYLNIDAILSIATNLNVDGIHPGYGFLSEEYEFAKRCMEENIIFIGPKWEVIKLAGNKVNLIKFLEDKNMNINRWKEIDVSKDQIIEYDMIFPVVIKPKSEGGGKGIEIITENKQFKDFINRDIDHSKYYIEKYISNCKHIEIQVFCQNDDIKILGTRNCSIQENNKKIIEEAPAKLDNKLEIQLKNEVIEICKVMKYNNIGTFEYLVKGNDFYLLEINPRIQVEHTITEEIYNLDIVELQINEALNIKQKVNLIESGHSLECRINIDINRFNEKSFKIYPDMTRIDIPNVRYDFSFDNQTPINCIYDELIGKVIILSESRDISIKLMNEILGGLKINGVNTNINFLKNILNNNEFRNNEYTTSIVSRIVKDEGSESTEVICSKCNMKLDITKFTMNYNVCYICSNYHRISPSQQVKYLFDEYKLLDIYKYSSQNQENFLNSTYIGKINDEKCIFTSLNNEANTLQQLEQKMGNELCTAIDIAINERYPLIVYISSGGVNITEGVAALNQMIRVNIKTNELDDKKLLYISILANPTFGGVMASFAVQGDIIIAEPRAKMGFAGPKVVKGIINESTKEIQTSEMMLKNGLLDAIVTRENQKEYIYDMIKYHKLKK